MPGAKTPAPYCSHSNPVNLDDGTSCRMPSPAPVPVGTTARGSSPEGGGPHPGISGHPAQRHSQSTIINGIIRAATWRDLERWAEIALGPSSFYLGICYGILENLAGSVAGVVDLLRVFILAGLYERAHHPAWAGAGIPEYLIAKAAELAFGSQLKKAHDQCETLMRELKYAVTHPGELLGSIRNEYAAKWRRFQTLIVDISLSGQFEAGKIAGEVLLDVLMLIGVGEAAVKFAAKLPELAKLAERFEGALKLGARAGGGAVAEEAEAASAVAERVATKRLPKPIPPKAGGETAAAASADTAAKPGAQSSKTRVADEPTEPAPRPKNSGPQLRSDLGDEWLDESGNPKWPPNNGSAGPEEPGILKKGTTIDRYGGEGGSFASKPEASYAQRSLPYDPATVPYQQYEVLKPLPTMESEAAPWFDQPGGAPQYRFDKSFRDLVDEGFLKPI